MEAQINFAQQKPSLLEEGAKRIDLELRVLQTDVYFEPDADVRTKKAGRFVAEYLRQINGEDNLDMRAASATLQGFAQEEAINGRFYLLLMFRGLTRRRVVDAEAGALSLERQLEATGGRLNDEERQELDAFVRNLDPHYSPPAYDARFNQYKREKAHELLKQLIPLP